MTVLALLAALVSVAATVAAGANATTTSTLQEWFTDNFLDGETQLVAGVSADRAALGDEFLVCGGLPALQTRSSVLPPNGACPDVFTAVNGSCTCLTGLSSDSEAWTFHVQPKASSGTVNGDALPVTQAATEVLEIDAIRSLWVPPTLLSLRFVGVGTSPVTLTLVPDDRSSVGNLSPIAQAAGTSVNVTVIEFSNIDLYQVAISAKSMIPSSATNMTLRDCNISSFGYDFATGLGSLKAVDLSLNQLMKPYAGSTVSSLTCSYTLCVLEEFNISFNSLTAFPSSTLSIKTLRKLYVQGNPLSDWNVSSSVFELIQGLDELVADTPDESTYSCRQGQWKTAHDVSFCVASDDNSTISGESASTDSTTAMLEYSAITGALLVVALLGILVWQRRRYNAEQRQRENRSNGAYGQSSAMGTMTRGENAAAQALLMREPQLAARRVDYRDIKLTKCLSRGGFGLVFVGELHGRRVAVKKMRADMGVEFHQLDLFVREISLMARLQHDRIVEFVGVAWEATSLMDIAAITELMEGGDLRDVLYHHHARRLNHSHTGSTSSREEGAVDEGEALTWSGAKLKIALHIAQALAYLHSRSPPVVHRDLKSKNVLLTSELDAKLGDFGISRERPDETNQMMTAGMGTNFWIAPEVLLGEDYDERADIFSFGVVLSEIDTDDFPYWNAEHPAGGKVEEGEILQLVAMGRKRPAFSPECPPAILALAGRCLSVTPHERPSAVELTYHLGRLQPALLEGRMPEKVENSYSPDADAVDEFEDAEWMLSGVYSDMSDMSDLSDFDEDKRLGSRRHRRVDDSARAVRIRQEGIYS